MFKKILIANRGEIACRIIRTAKKLGIITVAVYSDIDAQALHVKMADEVFLIGPAPSRDSYLNTEAILAVAHQAKADAIHPGYGFLSENAEFAQQCADANIIFIGPSAAAINAMGSKTNAKEIMAKANVSVTPGYYGNSSDPEIFQKEANKIGYPVLLKAAAGGGGKGMRLVHSAEEIPAALAATQREAKASFGDDEIFIEKYLPNCHHVEVQIFGDTFGNYVYLFERDCSIQRRHQKIIEEAPAPKISAKLRQQLGKVAIAAAKAINYQNAGTIEFLLAEDQKFYFMEMNTRLQVEHAITEMITGQDLVEWQLRIAAGEKLPLTQNQLQINGHAFEARIYAEDPNRNFLPSTGKLIHLKTPMETASVRIDSGVTQGDTISVYYDPLIAKLICWDKDRTSALNKLHQALSDYQIVGVTTNLELLKKITQEAKFVAGNISTHFLDKHKNLLVTGTKDFPIDIIVMGALFIILSHQVKDNVCEDPYSPWLARDSWRLNSTGFQIIEFIDQGKKITARINLNDNIHSIKIADTHYNASANLNHTELTVMLNEKSVIATVIQDKHTLHIFSDSHHYQLGIFNSIKDNGSASGLNSHLLAPMPGTVAAVLIKAGQKVQKGDGLMVIEAMKMEHTITAPIDGIIETIFFQPGELVEEGKELLKLNTA